MSNVGIQFRNEAGSSQGNSEIMVRNSPTKAKLARLGLTAGILGNNGFPILLATLSSPRMYDGNTNWRHEAGDMISTGIGSGKAAGIKKHISAKEARRIAILHLEEAEARRLRYAQELARPQTEGEESAEKVPSNEKHIISAKEARRLVLLDLEKAEARRRRYAEELARFQMERLEIGD